MSDVLAFVEGRVGRLRLNRPKELHALTTQMCRDMTAALKAWRTDPAIDLVMLDHCEGRGFCAGGDIRMLAESGAGDGKNAREFFFTEYRLNHLLFCYPKPVIAFMDGITMGGGVGISRPARYRVATERTLFAMPETGIGLFPDVGGGWYLSRMPGRIGAWLALTGARIKAADCLLLDIATHYVESGALDALKAQIVADPGSVEDLLASASVSPGVAPLQSLRAKVEPMFAPETVESVFAALQADDEWAREQHAVLSAKSPQSMKIALRQIAEGARAATFAENMTMEYRLAARVVQSADFIEGVRAVILEKDNAPKWRPSTLAGVTEPMLDSFFAPLPSGEEWTPLN